MDFTLQEDGEIQNNDMESAMTQLRQALQLPDGALLAGSVAHAQHHSGDSENSLLMALRHPVEIGTLFPKFGVRTRRGDPMRAEQGDDYSL